jgi:hypothetical protein
MAVPSVFISSVVTGFEETRAQAALAVEKMGMHPVLAEGEPASPDASRQTMLAAVRDSDYYLLLLGERYGEPGDSGKSPTEEEYDEACRRNQPVLALVQEGIEMEPKQRAFLERVRGDWGDGVFYARFARPDDVPIAVAAALNAQVTNAVQDIPAAQGRAAELARGEERSDATSSGVAVRVAMVPARETRLLDAVALEHPELGARLAEAARSARLIPQSIGIDTAKSSAGVKLTGSQDEDRTTPEVIVGADGSILAVASVRGEGTFGGSLIDPQRLDHVLNAVGRFANAAWQRIDRQGEVTRVAVCVAIPDADGKSFGSVSGSHMSISQGLPATVIAPSPALVVPRGQVTDADVINSLLAEVRRVFEDAGAVQT